MESAINLIRWLVHEILAGTNNQSLREGIHNPSTRAWNTAIRAALDNRFGHSRYNWRRIGQVLSVAAELTIQGEHSPFFLRVLSLVKVEED